MSDHQNSNATHNTNRPSHFKADFPNNEEEEMFNEVNQNHFNSHKNLIINRQWFTQSEFDIAGNYDHQKSSCKQKLTNCCSNCCPKDSKAWKSKILSLFPFITILKSYTRSDFFCDIISGLTVGVMHIPQGMAYGFLANIDPVYGLYTSFFSVFIYFFFGTSRHISIGVFAVVSLMIGSVVDKANCSVDPATLVSSSNSTGFDPLVNFQINSSDLSFVTKNFTEFSPESEEVADQLELCKVQHALAVTFVVGFIQLLMGILHFGFVTVYLSDPLTRGLTTGAAVHVFTSQIKHVFGISVGRYNGPLKLVYLYKEFFEEIKNTNPAPVVLSLVCIIIIYCLQRWVSPKLKKFIKIPLPAELLVLIIGTLISHFCNFSSKELFNMKVVGKIPQGIPAPQLPKLSLIPQVALDAVAIAIVTFTINISMAKMFSTKHEYHLESNQELIAYGLTNLVCSNLNSYVSTASLSRTLVQESTGGKTQVAGLISSILLLIVLLFVGPLFHDLPNCILAAVIIVNLRGIFLQVTDLPYLRKISKSDMLTWIVTCVGVVLTDVDLGLIIGLSFSFLTVVLRNQRPKVYCLGNIPGTEIYENVKEYKKAEEIENVKIFSFGTSLFYANAEHFQTSIHDQMFSSGDEEVREVVINETNLTKRKISNLNSEEEEKSGLPFNSENLTAEEKTRGSVKSLITDVVIDCGRMAFIDDVGIKALNLVFGELSKKKINLSLAHCSDEVALTIRKAMDLKKLERMRMFLTVHDAVTCISNSHL